jgi:hypothetical protein
MAVAIDEAMTGNGLYEHQLIAFWVIQHHVRHLAVGIDIDAKLGK